MAIDVNSLVGFSEAAFINTEPGPVGSMSLLIRGTFTDPRLNSGSWNPSSWVWNSGSTTGSLNPGASLAGITINNTDTNGASNLTNFKLCKRLVFAAKMGDREQQYVLDILDKQFFPNYTYFKVSASIDPENLTGISVFFKSTIDSGSSEEIYNDYECTGSGDISSVGISPYFSAEEASNFNPILNNVTGSVASTRTKRVEIIHTTGSEERQQTTVFATIPDSFYTKIANISGRYLGSKNSQITDYIGCKEDFTERNLNVLRESTVDYPSGSVIETGKNRAFFEASHFTGSVYLSGSLDEAIAAVGLSNMQLTILGFTQGLYYSASSFTGSAGGEVISGSRQSVIIPKLGTLPGLGDILYSDTELGYRLTEARIYSPDLNQILVTDTKGHVCQTVPVSGS